MKTTLLASTALVLSAGVASAAGFEMVDTGHDHSVVVGGDARMGIIHDGDDLDFTSRIRISFTASGETDGGMGFGGSIRADNADDGAGGTAGNVYISMGGHKLSMGDVAGGAEAAVGDLSGVGLTGLGDYNEFGYDTNDGDTRPNLQYSYTGGALSLYIGIMGEDGPEELGDGISVGAAYSFGSFGIAVGFENESTWDNEGVYLGAHADLGPATIKFIASDTDEFGEEVGASVDFTSGATTFTAFVMDSDSDGDTFGLGVSHDLGGGASLKAGIVDADDVGDTIWDAGISMKF
jgi:outer membrane protein OmpU